ncbi:putative bifunctional diguanylate cyclase/phosphodiesterase [Bacillus pinisoli]|uniref:putative bifunctional diguanylate cyclase/phosphodiesterase n=1 Tax=Bacillus pinisoli TaxID=2901866 RepID=UPI001FF3DEC5|nr:GGDEF domain-containing phosphodiesterase [Bacillus pinisoli]
MSKEIASRKMLVGALSSIFIIALLVTLLVHELVNLSHGISHYILPITSLVILAIYSILYLRGKFVLRTKGILLGILSLLLVDVFFYLLFKEEVLLDIVINLFVLIFTIPNIILVIKGVKHEIEMEEKLTQSEQQLRAMYNSLEVGIWLTDYHTKKLLFASPGMGKLSGIDVQSIFEDQTSWPRIIHPDDLKYIRSLQPQLDAGKSLHLEYRIFRSDGETRFVKEKVFPIFKEDGSISRVTGIIIDSTEEYRQAQQIEYMAFHDELTNLYNRRYFEKKLSELPELAEGNQMALMYIDLDRFKSINDIFSHDVGDQLLIQISHRILSCIQEKGVAFRLGGDEFAILLNQFTDEQELHDLANKIVKSLSMSYQIDSMTIHSSCSVGVTVWPKDTRDPQLLMKYTDATMYTIKQTGKNGYTLFDSTILKSLERKTFIEKGLREALENNQFLVYYQPQYKHGQIVGMEALLRWKTKTGEFIPPTEFIPIAEEVGLISSLGQWVLKQACLQGVAWQKVGVPPIKMAVNVSVKQLQRTGFYELVSQTLKETGLQPSLLELEITESLSLFEDPAFIEQLRMLRDIGVTITIDDFGTGFSSLAYLYKLPIDSIKIAREFTMDLEHNSKRQALVGAITGLAKHLDLHMLAEGVETIAQVNIYKELGCTTFQGYYFSKPINALEAKKLLEKNLQIQ